MIILLLLLCSAPLKQGRRQTMTTCLTPTPCGLPDSVPPPSCSALERRGFTLFSRSEWPRLGHTRLYYSSTTDITESDLVVAENSEAGWLE